MSNLQDAVLSSIFIVLQNHCTCFGCPLYSCIFIYFSEQVLTTDGLKLPPKLPPPQNTDFVNKIILSVLRGLSFSGSRPVVWADERCIGILKNNLVKLEKVRRLATVIESRIVQSCSFVHKYRCQQCHVTSIIVI